MKKIKWFSHVKSLKFFLFWSVFVFACIAYFLYSQMEYDSYRKRSLLRIKNQVLNEANILSDQIVANQFVISNGQDNLSVEIDQLANVMEGRVVVVDSNYRIVKDTFTIEQDKYLLSKQVFDVMTGKAELFENDLEGYIETVTPILDKNRAIMGAIVITVSTQSVESTLVYVKNQERILLAIFLAVAALIAGLISHIVTVNINRLNKKIEYMNNGHLDEPVATKGFEEVENLSDSIDNMVSKMQVLEDSRQEFVSNVSHELKTPITSMKVLADSLLLQGDTVPAQTYREFLVDIVEEIERENAIINDLLTLVKTDKKAASLNIAPVDMNQLIELLLKRMRPLAKKRNIEIEFESVRDVTAEIDEVKLSLAFSNLIENAIKYNKDNGWVKVSLNADHKFFYVQVEDSGVGIPDDCKEQVFERFYRVDKARSRETGGTGLGLAITRNAILLHKGAVKVYSKLGEGTTFTVRIPLNYIA